MQFLVAALCFIVALFPFRGRSLLERLKDIVPYAVAFFLFAVLFTLLMSIPARAQQQATAVSYGRPLAYRYFGPIARDLTFRADPAFVEAAKTDSVASKEKTSTTKTSSVDSVASLKGRLLIYLGQANGVVVLYDGQSRQALYLPSSEVILKVGRCKSPASPSPGCSSAWV